MANNRPGWWGIMIFSVVCAYVADERSRIRRNRVKSLFKPWTAFIVAINKPDERTGVTADVAHLLILMLLVNVVHGCGSSDKSAGGGAVVAPDFRAITVAGIAEELGYFDPAPTRDDEGRLTMSYSHVSRDSSGINLIETRLATSSDGGNSWADSGVLVNQANVFPVNTETVATAHEVSRLVYNPYSLAAGADPWLLAWHRYLSVLVGSDTQRLFEHGWIAVKSGATAATLDDERKLFTGLAYDTVNNSDALGEPEYPLDSMYAGLSDCVAFSEPGLLPKSDGIYLSLLCARAAPPGKIVLLRCDHHMNNCDYLGDLIAGSEAAALDAGYDNFSASEIVSAAGKDYLIVTPSQSTLYRGCVVYEIIDLPGAALLRDSSGRDRPVAVFEAHGDFNGACGYTEGLKGSGIIISEAFFNSLPVFRLFTTGFGL